MMIEVLYIQQSMYWHLNVARFTRICSQRLPRNVEQLRLASGGAIWYISNKTKIRIIDAK
ncbi:MAG TPA: hypothetical protein VNG51_29590 [Ktedonobacteraceae bacterium]|nr:hypothetical protein [Ktedonobacteraceae bacterium]